MYKEFLPICSSSFTYFFRLPKQFPKYSNEKIKPPEQYNDNAVDPPVIPVKSVSKSSKVTTNYRNTKHKNRRPKRGKSKSLHETFKVWLWSLSLTPAENKYKLLWQSSGLDSKHLGYTLSKWHNVYKKYRVYVPCLK